MLHRRQLWRRKIYQAVEVGLNQQLTYNSILARRGRAVLMSNDAKGYYNRITLVVVGLALQRLNIPKPAISSMLETIPEMGHFHCTNSIRQFHELLRQQPITPSTLWHSPSEWSRLSWMVCHRNTSYRHHARSKFWIHTVVSHPQLSMSDSVLCLRQ